MAALLLFDGYMAAQVIHWSRDVLNGAQPFAETYTIEQTREALSLMYALAFQGLLGLIALALAAALLFERPWAHRALLIGSVVLSCSSILVIALRPHLWDTQGLFALAPLLYLWEWRTKKNAAPAP